MREASGAAPAVGGRELVVTAPVPGGGYLVAVDPGLQVTAAAIFDLSKCVPSTSLAEDPAGWVGAARGLVGVESLRVQGSDLTAKCTAIALWMTDLVERRGITRMMIEVPHRDGSYSGVRRRQQTRGMINAASIAKLNQAISAIRVSAGQLRVPVTDVRAAFGVLTKDARHIHLQRALRMARRDDLKGNQHERDAAWLGMWSLARELNGQVLAGEVAPC